MSLLEFVIFVLFIELVCGGWVLESEKWVINVIFMDKNRFWYIKFIRFFLFNFFEENRN